MYIANVQKRSLNFHLFLINRISHQNNQILHLVFLYFMKTNYSACDDNIFNKM